MSITALVVSLVVHAEKRYTFQRRCYVCDSLQPNPLRRHYRRPRRAAYQHRQSISITEIIIFLEVFYEQVL